jgi:hypothetical protein
LIVKLQVPIGTDFPPEEHLALIYNELQSFELMTPVTDEIKEQMNGRFKAFFEIDLREGNPFRFVREVPDQGW